MEKETALPEESDAAVEVSQVIRYQMEVAEG